MPQEPDVSSVGAEMVYHEIHAVIRRYMDEAPDTTAFQIIGALEAAKADLMETLRKHNAKGDDAS